MNLNEVLASATAKLGFKTLKAEQRADIKSFVRGHDVLRHYQLDTGKAYVLPFYNLSTIYYGAIQVLLRLSIAFHSSCL